MHDRREVELRAASCLLQNLSFPDAGAADDGSSPACGPQNGVVDVPALSRARIGELPFIAREELVQFISGEVEFCEGRSAVIRMMMRDEQQ